MNSKTEQVFELHDAGWSLRNIANEVGLSVFTVRQVISKRSDATPTEVVALSGVPKAKDPKKSEALKKKLVKRFNALVDELLDNCEDTTWTIEEVENYAASVDNLRTEVADFCEENDMDCDNLAIYENATELYNYMTDEEAFDEDADTVDFDFDEERYEEFESLKIKHFEDESTGIDLMAYSED